MFNSVHRLRKLHPVRMFPNNSNIICTNSNIFGKKRISVQSLLNYPYYFLKCDKIRKRHQPLSTGFYHHAPPDDPAKPGESYLLIYCVQNTRGVQKVRSLTQLPTRYAHHILSLFNVVFRNWNVLGPAFLQSSDSVAEELLFWSSSQPFAVQITTSSSENWCLLMNSFSLGNR